MKKTALALALALPLLAHAENAGDDQRTAKMNAYIECYNRADDSAHTSIERYQSWIKDMKKGPTGKESHIYGIHDIHENVIKLCNKSMTEGLAIEPAAPELDAAAKQYLDNLNALKEKVSEAHKYYERENYKDDKFAKGKEMHAPLVAAMTAFEKASEDFSAKLEAENDKVLRARLEELEKAGDKNAEYWTLATTLDAKALTNLMQADTFDTDAASKLIDAYEKNADGLAEYSKAHHDDWMAGSFLSNAAEEYRVAAKERMRRVRDKEPYSQGEKMHLNPDAGWMVKGSPYKLLRAYNDLISAANR